MTHLNHWKFLSVVCLVSRLNIAGGAVLLPHFEDDSAAAACMLFGKFHEKFSFTLVRCSLFVQGGVAVDMSFVSDKIRLELSILSPCAVTALFDNFGNLDYVGKVRQPVVLRPETKNKQTVMMLMRES